MNQQATQIIIIFTIAILILLLLVLFGILRKKNPRPKKPAETIPVPETYLLDKLQKTGQRLYRLTAKPLVLGRICGRDDAHFDYLAIPDATIGRRHALIEYTEFAFWILDQGSLNGTYVNDNIVTRKRLLKHGDIIKLHKYEFEFILPEMESAGKTIRSVVNKKAAETDPPLLEVDSISHDDASMEEATMINIAGKEEVEPAVGEQKSILDNVETILSDDLDNIDADSAKQDKT